MSAGADFGRRGKLRWQFNRLRLMSVQEVGWRLACAARVRLERRGIGLATVQPASLAMFGKPWTADLQPAVDPAPYVDAAERILAGYFNIFALRNARVGFPPPWNRDPKTGIDAPLGHGKSMDYRDPSVVGDIKYLWQPNRHYELLTLAQAFRLSGQRQYAEGCRRLLESWFDDCPYPRGQGWASALENAIRLVNWALAWHLLGGVDSMLFTGEGGKLFLQRWLGCVRQHCHFIAGHLSRHSSANNHLLGEYMGLYVGALTWPCWTESTAWRDHAWHGLQTEAYRQNAPDGVNREQAVWYQHEVIDMLLLCGLFARANDLPVPQSYWQRLEAMLSFLAALMDTAGNVPMIGDADDATLPLSCEPGHHPVRSLLATGALLFARHDFKARAGRCDDKTRWLLDVKDVSMPDPGSASEARHGPLPRQAFTQGGYYVLGADFDTLQEVRIVADAGPLGYLGIAAHGHADALALTLSAGGMPLLIDPGTFAYHTQPEWRAYFRGTAAHNTVRIDGLDQSVQGGNFMWLHKARATCEAWHSNDRHDRFIGSHDGYARLPDPLWHRRKMVYDKTARELLVVDTLSCQDVHDIELHWHFSERCQVRMRATGVVATCGAVQLLLTLPDAACATAKIVVGQISPPLGWISYRFDEKCPSPTLVYRERISGTVQRLTRLQVRFIEPGPLLADERETPEAIQRIP